MCVRREGRRGVPGRVERVWEVKDGVWQLFTANTILAWLCVPALLENYI